MEIRQFWLLLLIWLVSAASVSAYAHEYWYERDGEDYLLHRGHGFTSTHGGEVEEPFDPSVIKSAHCLGYGESDPRPGQVSAEYPPRVEGPCLAVLVAADFGYWSQTQTGAENRPKDEVTGALDSWHALETIKRIEDWDERLQSPLSDDLELVLTSNPFSRSVRDKLRLAAMLEGKPVSGVVIAYDGNPRGITGPDGRTNVRIQHLGPQVISASLEEPLDSAKADKRIRSTTLLFDIAEPE
ncbi:MAG: hypothetical protein QNJ73_00820 [Gammaproteobacteria bacterium]|nr:hypothetical protein [Gammaproteobacteria bacterium]